MRSVEIEMEDLNMDGLSSCKLDILHCVVSSASSCCELCEVTLPLHPPTFSHGPELLSKDTPPSK